MGLVIPKNFRLPRPNRIASLGAVGYDPPVGRQLLTQNDMTYLGKYRLGPSLGQWGYGITSSNALAFRRVGGEKRFIFIYGEAYDGIGQCPLIEVRVTGSIGSTIPASDLTNYWPTFMWGGGWGAFLSGTHYSLGIDDQDSNELWINWAIDYPADNETFYTDCITVRTLNSNGTTSNYRSYGVEGIGQRAHYGGARRVPAWARAAYGFKEFLSGFGGYASRAAQGLGPSYGSFMVNIDDPRLLPNGSTIDAADAYILADHVSASTSDDWFDLPAPVSNDRGIRNPYYTNFYDGNDIRPNPVPGRPTYPDDYSGTGSWWTGPNQEPAPDGHGRYMPNDSFNGAWLWLDDDLGSYSRHGVIAINSAGGGYGWYQTSAMTTDYLLAEMQVFDPAHLAEVKAGIRPTWALQPTAYWDLTPDMVADPAGPNGEWGNGEDSVWGANKLHASNGAGQITGMAFDADEKILYVARWDALRFNGVPIIGEAYIYAYLINTNSLL